MGDADNPSINYECLYCGSMEMTVFDCCRIIADILLTREVDVIHIVTIAPNVIMSSATI